VSSLTISACYFSCTAGNTQFGCVTMCSACSLTGFLSVSFKVAIPHPSRFTTHHPTNPLYTVRASYGENKETLKHIKMTLPLEKIALAKIIVHYEKISSSSRGKKTRTHKHAHTYTRGYTDRDKFEINTHTCIIVWTYFLSLMTTWLYINSFKP
jgi:hypothetical protein